MNKVMDFKQHKSDKKNQIELPKEAEMIFKSIADVLVDELNFYNLSYEKREDLVFNIYSVARFFERRIYKDIENPVETKVIFLK
ncbi:hypothetical protein FC778_15305 [Clostridium botulinum]|nr:hypothetical protein [Clostridium botulinum]